MKFENSSKCFYCIKCGKILRKFRNKKDWITRKKHLACFKLPSYSFDDQYKFFTGEKIQK